MSLNEDNSKESPVTATLTFLLPEAEKDLRVALDGAEWKRVAYEVDLWIRNKLKHGEVEKEFKTPGEALEALRSHLREEIQFRNLAIDE
tara:strand:- start:748 stop:1014 length:267 start_codon:yes stop_codon:yes gene_type:complete